jgi:uncharacterized phage protein (TIGR01671 family)
MRDLRFRGLRVDGKGWVCGFYRKNTFYNLLGDEPLEVYTKYFIGCFDNKTRFDNIFEQVEVKPESVGQFTGLQDKNGVDIYEGDIISSKSWNPQQYEIIFEEGEFCFVSLEKVEAPYTNAIHHCIYFEVIGNIHE